MDTSTTQDLLGLAKLALNGRAGEARIYVNRLIKKYRKTDPDVASVLQALLHTEYSQINPCNEISLGTMGICTLQVPESVNDLMWEDLGKFGDPTN